MQRIDPDSVAAERTTLIQYLDYQRATVLMKTEGLSSEQSNRSLAPSALTAAGIVKHLWLVEESWIKERFLGTPEAEPWAGAPVDDPDWEFNSAADDDPEWLRTSYKQACAANNELIESHGLDALAAIPLRDGRDWTLRWVLLHLIEETARHVGHLDLIRESIDGTVGE